MGLLRVAKHLASVRLSACDMNDLDWTTMARLDQRNVEHIRYSRLRHASGTGQEGGGEEEAEGEEGAVQSYWQGGRVCAAGCQPVVWHYGRSGWWRDEDVPKFRLIYTAPSNLLGHAKLFCSTGTSDFFYRAVLSSRKIELMCKDTHGCFTYHPAKLACQAGVSHSLAKI